MDPLNIVTWRWGDKYPSSYVEKLKRALARHVKQEYKFSVMAPSEGDLYLTDIPGCFCRMRMFDPAWQEQHGFTGRIVCLDLDLIVTGNLDELFDRPEDFVILQGANASNPCPYNGSVMMLRTGTNAQIWKDFHIEEVATIEHYEFPDDQGWLAHKLPNAAGWRVGKESGIYAFQKPGWPKGVDLPSGARLVAFPGWRDPSMFNNLQWVREHWQ